MPSGVTLGGEALNENPTIVSANVEPSDWLYVDVLAGELRIFEGTTVEIHGTGSLRFREGRRVIEYPGDLRLHVDGTAVSSSGTIAPGAEVFLLGRDGEVR